MNLVLVLPLVSRHKYIIYLDNAALGGYLSPVLCPFIKLVEPEQQNKSRNASGKGFFCKKCSSAVLGASEASPLPPSQKDTKRQEEEERLPIPPSKRKKKRRKKSLLFVNPMSKSPTIVPDIRLRRIILLHPLISIRQRHVFEPIDVKFPRPALLLHG